MARMLLVDDDPTDRMLMRRAFARECGALQFTEFSDGPSALESFESIRPDVTLLDIRMPGMDGFEVLRALRKKHAFRQHPVILVSSSRQRDEIQKAHEEGANAYFEKPTTLAAYSALATDIFRNWVVSTQG